MISEGSHNCFSNSCDAMHHNHNRNHNQMYPDVVLETSSTGAEGGGSETTQLGSFLCNLTSLKEKVHQVQSLVSLYLSCENQESRTTDESTSIALASMSTLIQEIVVTASSMMFNCQQMALCSPQGANNNNNNNNHHSNHHDEEQKKMVSIPSHHIGHEDQVVKQLSEDGLTQLSPRRGTGNNLGFLDGGSFFNWYVDNTLYNNNDGAMIPNTTTAPTTSSASTHERQGGWSRPANRDKKQVVATSSNSQQGFDIVELDAAALLAKYTHYCQVCGKGFKRDANLRMHMRAHGDEYKSNAALTNPLKNKKQDINGDDESSITKAIPRKYSCPQEGCRWNKKHARFQPLKSMICVKNHYKRSHCPKMYVCKRCNQKQFSILSDLRTHEKHCGDLKWQCTCGTTFSRKDKLMGHVTLFVGHSPLVSPLTHSTHNLQTLQNPL